MPFQSHSDFTDIPDDTVLWRYVDLYRLLDLVQTSGLHLTRVDQMEDRWEGSFSSVNVAHRPKIYGEHWPAVSSAFPGMYAFTRAHVYVNCWYMGSDESYAMWRLYDASGKGVAVRTTAARLKAALQGAVMIFGAKVLYVDYNATYIPESNLFLPYVHKRRSFAHESEYRLITAWSPKVLELDEHKAAVRTEPDTPPPFLRESVDLLSLIEAIYVSPDAPNWAARVVNDVVHRYVPGVGVTQSDLGADPVV
jgi:hypothetical protein